MRLFLGASLLLTLAWIYSPTAMASSSLLTDASPQTMNIDLLPGNEDNSINLARQRMVPVAILGSSSFDVNDLNPRTLKLQARDVNLVGKSDKSLCQQQDINNDSYMDLVCNIKTIGFRVEPGDIEVTISAGTYQRQSLRASGIIRYVAE